MDFQGGMIVLIVFVSLFCDLALFSILFRWDSWFSALVSGVRISLCATGAVRLAQGPPSTIVSSMIESTKPD